MFTRKLLKHFFTFSLFALMLLPQISGQSSAFAAGISAVPSPPVNPECLDVSGSKVGPGPGTILPAVSLPGYDVDIDFTLNTMNNCSETVTGVLHGGVITATCNGGNIAPPQNRRVPLSGNLASGLHDGGEYHTTVGCITLVNNIPTRSSVPLTITMDVSATGTTASGLLVSSAHKILTFTWS